MEIYLDANATTPVLPAAREAALAVMAESFGNPSSIHGSGLRARAVLDEVRACARRVLQAPSGRLLFTSGATEGIQTAVLSALSHLRAQRDAGQAVPRLLLYGATEHKAVPEAIKHWNALLGLNLEMRAIPVGRDGRHDLDWLRTHAAQAGLVCTMAANNETGVVSKLDGIAAVLRGSGALWLVDGVQALGKMALKPVERGIDYAPFSGHKLYAPKGVGMLYVRDGAPFTPLQAGGGQEGGARAGTENMAGIAALGAVLATLESGQGFAGPAQMQAQREQLADALREAFAGIVFNAPFEHSLPTTLNFSVPGFSSRLLLDLFDAAGLRVSGGSACSAGNSAPSYVLEAMGLPAWAAGAAVRLSFGAADTADRIGEACARIRDCAESLRASCQLPGPVADASARPELLTRFVVEGACCYVLSDADSRRCVVIDPLPELTERLAQWLRCRGCELVAVLDTHSHGDHESSAAALRAAVGNAQQELDPLGWPQGTSQLTLGHLRLTRLALPGHTADSQAYLLHDMQGLRLAFVGDTVMPGALGRSDFAQSAPTQFATSLRSLAEAVGPHALLLPAHDYDNRIATSLALETTAQPLLAAALQNGWSDADFARHKATLEQDIAPTAYATMACGARACSADAGAPTESVELAAQGLQRIGGRALLVDVREPYEQRLGGLPPLGLDTQAAPLSTLLSSLPAWLASGRPLVFVCRSGNRSSQAARALRRLGHARAWSLAGGLALFG